MNALLHRLLRRSRRSGMSSMLSLVHGGLRVSRIRLNANFLLDLSSSPRSHLSNRARNSPCKEVSLGGGFLEVGADALDHLNDDNLHNTVFRHGLCHDSDRPTTRHSWTIDDNFHSPWWLSNRCLCTSILYRCDYCVLGMLHPSITHHTRDSKATIGSDLWSNR